MNTFSLAFAAMAVVLSPCANAIDIRHLRTSHHRVAMEGHPCSATTLTRAQAPGDCATRKKNHCHVCPANTWDIRSTEEAFASVNVCVHNVEKNCALVKHHDKTAPITNAGVTCWVKDEGGEVTDKLAGCNLQVADSEIKQVFTKAGLEAPVVREMWNVDKFTTTGVAYFMHVSPAGDAIVSSGELRANRGADDTAGGLNSPAATKNCKGYAYLWPVNADTDTHQARAHSVFRSIVQGFPGMKKIKDTLQVVLVKVPAGFVVETDPDWLAGALRHKGTISQGNGIELSIIDHS